MSPRILFFTGKGGVGKTTAAAATALALAERGTKTLLLSADAAHSVGDVLGMPVGDVPAEVTGGLYAAHVDPQRRFEAAWGTLQRQLVALMSDGGADPITAEELTVLPGVEEVLALLAVRDHARDGRFDAVVVDCGPSAETLRLLAVPEALRWYLERILPVQRRITRGARPVAGLFGAGHALPPDSLFDAVLRLTEDLRAVRDLLADPRVSSVRLVLTPESMVVAEGRRTYTALALYGYRVDGVIVNRVLPRNAGSWGTAWRAVQHRQLAEIDASFGSLPVRRLAYQTGEPIGVSALGAVAAELYTDADPLSEAPPMQLLRVEPDGDDFRLVIALPLAEAGAVDAARSGDDLVLTVAGHRRLIALPSVLRRCRVSGGRFVDGELRLRFVRDPVLWPGTSS